MSDINKAIEATESKVDELTKRVAALQGSNNFSVDSVSKEELLALIDEIQIAANDDAQKIKELTAANTKLKYRCNFLVRELNLAEQNAKQ